MDTVESEPRPPEYSLAALTGYFLKLGTLGFGGPVALVGFMHRDLVERRGWISDADYKEGLALSQLAPGPLAAQLAIYLGYVHYGVTGATAAGIAFVLPSFLMVLVLGWAYVLYGGLDWMQAVFYGVGAAVIAIIAHSAYKLTKKSIGNDWLLWAVWLVAAFETIRTETEEVWLFLGAGLVVWLIQSPPRFLRGNTTVTGLLAVSLPEAISAVPSASYETLGTMALFFAKAGAFVFGSGLAIVPFLYGGVVKEYQWLTELQFLDAVAVAMITPGPVVITVGFIGFIVGGFTGATIAALATFLPCYLFTIIPAPYFKKYGKRPGIVNFVNGVTAAAIGAISGAVVVLGRRSIFTDGWYPEWPKLVILLVTLAVLATARRIPEPILVLAAAVIGLVVYPLAR